MKKFQTLERFPLGAIRAEGFLKEQMQRGKEGICGQLHVLEPEMIYWPYIDRKPVPRWGKDFQVGWGAEISGNYWLGYIQGAFTLNDPEMIATATDWVDKMLKNQRPDGYLGAYYKDEDPRMDDFCAWGTHCAMRALIAFYEATGRTDVLDAVHKCMLWFCENWAGDNKTDYGGSNLIESMILTYHLTGDERLVRFAEDYLDYLNKNDGINTVAGMLSDRSFYNTQHAAGAGYHVRLPALVYSATGKQDYLKATEKRLRAIHEKSDHLVGGPSSITEFITPRGSVAETEYCAYANFNMAYSCLSAITGNIQYGDYMENLFYNGAQGARKKDEKAIAYFNSPNQLFATESSSSSFGDRQVYAPCHFVACCPVNAVVVVPEFIRGMLLRDGCDNVYAMAYGPCSLHYKDISINVNTLYPFRNKVAFEVNCDRRFALKLKIPGWCKSFAVTVNGEEAKLTQEKGFVTLDRAWKPGDVAQIAFEMKVEVVKIDDSDCSKKYPLGITYGPLVFAHHIKEQWIPTKGRPNRELPEGWSWWNVVPDVNYDDPDVTDPHEKLRRRREKHTWNMAFDENITGDDFTVEEIEKDGYVWEKPMLKLHTKAWRAPYLFGLYPAKTHEPCGEYQYVTEQIDVTLEPYGCTNLRIAYFAKADLAGKK